MPKQFIIIAQDPIVSLDLEDALVQRFPDCELTLSTSLLKSGLSLTQCGPESTVFVTSGLVGDAPDMIRVLRGAHTRGCSVVTIGAIEGLGSFTHSIEMPFTTEMVLAAVFGTSGIHAE